jgi:hypothetical protein
MRSYGCSDRLVDAIVAWGSEEKIRERIEAHFRAGATHVCIQALRADGKPLPNLRASRPPPPRNHDDGFTAENRCLGGWLLPDMCSTKGGHRSLQLKRSASKNSKTVTQASAGPA